MLYCRSASLHSHFPPPQIAFFFFVFSFGAVGALGVGVGSVRFLVGWVCGGAVPRFVVLFLFLLWCLFLLFLLPLFVSFRALVPSVFVVLVRLFRLRGCGRPLWLPFLVALPFLAVVLAVCAVLLVLRFLPLRSFVLLPLVVGVVRSLLVPLLWSVLLPLRLVRFGCPSRVFLALLGLFLLLVRVRVFVGWVRVRGLRLRSLAVRVFLRWCGCPLGVPFLLRGVLLRWGAVGFSAPSLLIFLIFCYGFS